jgi:endo-1,3-1,4-beta-glycanase ExoK
LPDPTLATLLAKWINHLVAATTPGEAMNIRHISTLTCTLCILAWSARSHAYASAEILTNQSYQYGRFEASVEFPSGSGVVGSFFLWKDGSEVEGTFWNELDIEVIGAGCELHTNAYYGDPAVIHSRTEATTGLCGAFHTYAYEWTPDYIAWFVDGAEIRRETGEAAAAFRDNTADGMQFRFNIWPGDASFGGTFDPNLLPVYQHIDWVQYSSYDGGNFVVQWREDFTANAIPSDWDLGTWESPKGLSTHSIENAGVVDGVLVLALTADDAQGIPGVDPGTGGQGGTGGTGGSEPTGGVIETGGTGGGSPATGGIPTSTGGVPSTGGIPNTGGSPTSTGGILGTGGVDTETGGGGGTPTGGTPTGGIPGQGGTSTGGDSTTTGGLGTGGSVTGGSGAATGGFVASSTGGGGISNATGGTGTALGGTDDPGVASPDADTGCTCHTTGDRSNTGVPLILGAFGLLAVGVARRRRRRPGRPKACRLALIRCTCKS